ENFTIVQVQIGPYTRPDIFPLVNGKPTNLESLEALVEEGKFAKDDFEKIKRKYQEFSQEIVLISKKINSLQKELSKKLSELEIKIITPLVEEETSEIQKKYNNQAMY
ncbi:MAG: ATP-dependent protease, partial [Parcubacteria bacterium 32_520]